MSPPILLAEPSFGAEEVDAVRATLESGWVAGQGPRGTELEQRFGQLAGRAHGVAVSNCTAALHLAMVGFGLGPGDEVLVADYSYPAPGCAVLYTGARPVFVDVRPDTWTIDVDAASDAITPRTRGIIAVDLFGQCADYEPLVGLARSRDLFLVEDAAAGAGASYRGAPAGSFGDLACFSLHARKGITSGEGGVLVTDDAGRADRARSLSCFGVQSAFEREQDTDLPVPEFATLGYNYKLSDIAAAIALVQLDRLPALLDARRKIAHRYRDRLADVDGVTLPVQGDDREHTWQSYVVTLDAEIPRGAVAHRLRTAEVQCNIGTFACHRQPVFGERPECPVSAALARQQLAIPMHANLSESDVERVADTLVDALRSA